MSHRENIADYVERFGREWKSKEKIVADILLLIETLIGIVNDEIRRMARENLKDKRKHSFKSAKTKR